ncbi:MAG: transcription antitermination factor NusB [Anaerovoracaceae bacterium]
MTRSEAREVLMQAVFQMDAQNDQSEELVELLIKDKKSDDKQIDYIRSSFREIKFNLEEIDKTINRNSRSWNTERMAKTDLAILRVAIYEMEYNETVPVPVTINEAVNMAKKFGGPDSQKFINGILGSVERA